MPPALQRSAIPWSSPDPPGALEFPAEPAPAPEGSGRRTRPSPTGTPGRTDLRAQPTTPAVRPWQKEPTDAAVFGSQIQTKADSSHSTARAPTAAADSSRRECALCGRTRAVPLRSDYPRLARAARKPHAFSALPHASECKRRRESSLRVEQSAVRGARRRVHPWRPPPTRKLLRGHGFVFRYANTVPCLPQPRRFPDRPTSVPRLPHLPPRPQRPP